MEDILLLQAIERYLDGSMLPAEKAYFEELRQNTPEIDQMVVEHNMFLHHIDNFSSRENLKQNLFNVHAKLLSIGDISDSDVQTPRVKIISIWNKHKRVTAIAAAVGGVIALMTSILVSKYKDVSPAVELLSYKQIQVQQQIADIKNEINKSKIPTTAEIKGGGSSFLIDGRGYLVTNAHVLDDATYASVFNEKGKEFNAIIAYKNDVKDLAILKIVDEDFETIKNLPYGIKKTNADLGDEIFTIGFPNFPRTDVVYNNGYLSSTKGYRGDTLACQIQMNANHGNSGGPIFNKRGEVVGVLSTKLSKADGVSFAIKSKNIYQIVEELKKSDSSYSNIKLSSVSSMNQEERVEQIKKIENFVYMVKAYKK